MESKGISTIKDKAHSKIVTEAQIANGELLLVDPSGKEYPITDYAKDLGPERARAILDKIVLMKMASSLRSASLDAIIRTFIETLKDLMGSGNGKIAMNNYIDALETELTFHKFIRDVAEEKEESQIDPHDDPSDDIHLEQ